MRRSTLAFTAALLLASAVAGCTSSGVVNADAMESVDALAPTADSAAAATPRTVPVSDPKRLRGVHVQDVGTDVETQFGPQAKWIERGKTFSITTWGSGSCPNTPTSIEVISASLIVVDLDLSDPFCTMDLRPTSFALDLPPDVTGRPLTVAFKHAIWVQADEQGPKTRVLPQFVLD